MSKVTTFSRTFPGYHPRKGQPTHFIEKILNRLKSDDYFTHWKHPNYINVLYELNKAKIKEGKLTYESIRAFYKSLDKTITETKGHTIRAGHRWEAGKFTAPAVWSGRPYHTPQIIFAPDIELKKVWDFEMNKLEVIIDKYKLYQTGDDKIEIVKKIAENDGLNTQNFLDWFQFPKPFRGQIICWDENVNY